MEHVGARIAVVGWDGRRRRVWRKRLVVLVERLGQKLLRLVLVERLGYKLLRAKIY